MNADESDAGRGCAQWREQLELFALDALETAPRAELMTHFAKCDACARELAALRALTEGLRAAADPGADAALAHARQRVAGAAAARRRWRHAASLLRLAAALAVALGVWCAARGGRPGAEPTPCACEPWTQPGFRWCAHGQPAGAPARSRAVFGVRDTAQGTLLVALERHRGATRWERPIDVRGCPVADGRRVYLLSRDADGIDNVLALDAATGGDLWRQPMATGGPVQWRLAPQRGSIAWSAGGRVGALDARTGAPRWTRELGVGLALPEAAPEGPVLVASARMLFALDAATGATLWSREHDLHGLLRGPPLVAGDARRVCVAGRGRDGRGSLRCWDTRTGAALWEARTAAPQHLALAGDRLYVRSAGVEGRDAVTGRRLWSAAVGGCSPLSVSGETVYVVEGRDRMGIYGLRGADGRRQWEHRALSSCGAFVVDGRMGYLTTADGVLHALPVDARG